MLNYIKYLLIAIFIIPFSIYAQTDTNKATPKTAPPILKIIQEKYSGKATFEAEFDVTIFWAVREKEEKRSGRLTVAPGDKFRVESSTTVWVSNGVTYWQYSRKNNQVLVKRLLDVDISMLPSSLIAEYLTAFEYKAVQDLPERCLLEGRPDAAHAQSDVVSLVVTVDKKNNTISRIMVTDKDQNKSTYSFKKARFGSQIAPAVFEYTPPAGAAIIDARE
jgi:outer membrane lipoprotein carrier protein